MLSKPGPFREDLWWQHLKRQVRSHRRPDLSESGQETDTSTNAHNRISLWQENPGLEEKGQLGEKLRGESWKTVLLAVGIPANVTASRTQKKICFNTTLLSIVGSNF